MTDFQTIRVTLPLKVKFWVARGEASQKTNFITIMNNRYSGEAATSVQYGPTLAGLESDLRQGINNLKRRKKIDIDTLEAINKYKIHPIARSALTCMVLNYLSGEMQRYPWEILGLGTPVGIRNSITVSIGEPEDVITAIRESDYPIVKVKMGSDYDAELVQRLEEVAGKKELRIDANGGWSCEKAEEMVFHLGRHGVKVIEQPTSIEHVKEWPHIKAKNAEVELILDEGLESMDDYQNFAEYIDGINIKMEKSGGILEASRIARRAREDKKKVLLGCMVESSVGIAQSVYMSSLADYHDLDAPQLLVDDIAQGITYENNTIHVDREIIGGPVLKRDVVEKYISE